MGRNLPERENYYLLPSSAETFLQYSVLSELHICQIFLVKK
jgi:hypothetical protein